MSSLSANMEQILDRFDESWNGPTPPRIEDYLASGDSDYRLPLLIELIRIDLERRLTAGERVRLEETYLRRFPELSADLPAVASLAKQEFELRRRNEPDLTPAEYVERFPQCRTELLAQLSTLGEDGGPEQRQPSEGSAPTASAMTELDLRGYELIEALGKGGMGEVYRCGDPALGRDLAIKVMKAAHQVYPEVERRFLREARVTASLQHPGIVPVHNLGRLRDGRMHYTMRLVRGQTLAAILKEEAGKTERVPFLLSIFEKICQAVAYAHSKRVIHRDLKPANVMVGRFGEVQVMDWGLAKLLTAEDEPAAAEGAAESEGTRIHTEEADTPLAETRLGREMGTPAYMPPEQALGEWDAVDERADVFALGSILCEILTGKPVYRGRDGSEVSRRAKRGDMAEALERLQQSGADAVLTALCRECLSPNRDERPRDAAVVANRLAAYQAQVQERLRQSELERARAEVKALEERKRRRLMAALALAALVLMGSGVAGWWQWQQRQAEADDAVKNALSDARLLQQQAQAGPLTAGAYAQAVAAARKAEDIARAGGASARMQQQAAELLAQCQQAAEEAAKDRQLLTALLEVRGPREGPQYSRNAKGMIIALSEPTAEEQFASAFRAWGLDVDAASPAEAAARLKERPAVVVTEVIASLDEWANQRRQDRKPEKQWRRLAELAAALDDDAGSMRAELREILARGRLPIERALGTLAAALRPVPVPVEMPLGQDCSRLRRLAEKMDPAAEPVLGLLTLMRALRLAGEEALAEQVLRKALIARPREVVLYHKLGQLLTEQNPPRYAEAVECYAAARALRTDLGVALAEALQNSGRAEEGLALLTRLLRESPNSPYLHYQHGFILSLQGKFAEAEAAFRQAIALQPDNIDAQHNLGIALYYQAKQEEAEAVFRKAIERKPNEARLYACLGLVLETRGKHAEAQAAFRKSIALNPNDVIAYTVLGYTLARQGKTLDAVAAFLKAGVNRPDLAWVYTYFSYTVRGNDLRTKRDLDGAIAYYKKAIDLIPKGADALKTLANAVAQHSLGLAFYAKGDWDSAIGCFRKALDLDPQFEALGLNPQFADIHNDLGIALHDKGDLDRAMACYKKALDLKPNHIHAHNNIGNVLRAKGEVENAIACYKKALAIDPGYALGHNNLANALYDLGEVNAAAKEYRKAVELGMAGSKQQLQRCQRLLALGERLPAILLGEKEPEDAAQQIDLAYLTYAMKRYGQSARLFADAFAAEPKFATDLEQQHRYNAACSAALAAARQGQDARLLSDADAVKFHRWALGWLHDDLTAYAKLDEPNKDAPKPNVPLLLAHWKRDPDLAAVRDLLALDRLPDNERAAWQSLWRDVDKLAKKEETKAAQKKSKP